MNTRRFVASVRRKNEKPMRWNTILRNLATLKAARLVLMDLKHELRSMDHSRLVVDGILFCCIEGQVWTIRVIQE